MDKTGIGKPQIFLNVNSFVEKVNVNKCWSYMEHNKWTVDSRENSTNITNMDKLNLLDDLCVLPANLQGMLIKNEPSTDENQNSFS